MSIKSKPIGGIFYTLKLLLKNESFLRPTIIFAIFYVFILMENWSDIILLLIPIITYVMFTFFKIVDVSKEHTIVNGSKISFNPIGNEKIIANRLFFCLLLEMILIFAMGTESIFHPQLINDYFIYYVIPLVLIYIFSLYYMFYDVGFSANIELLLKDELHDDLGGYKSNKLTDKKKKKKDGELISYLNLSEYKKIHTVVRFICISLGLMWVILSLLGNFGIIPLSIIPNILISVPGTRLLGGSSVEVSTFIYICIFAFPICFVIITARIYQLIAKIDNNALQSIIAGFPKMQQKKIIKTLEFYTTRTSKRKDIDQDI
ncbi:MAG: hypothetical protein ACTSWY_01955 [Promethearchaeota archaeon]